MEPSQTEAPLTDTYEPTQAHIARLARTALAVVVLLQALGLIMSLLKQGTPVGTWLFLDHLWPEPATKQFQRAGTIVAVLGSSLAVLARKPLARYLGAGLASGWCLALALAEWRMGGAPFTQLAVPAHATRIAAPLLLALWDRKGVAAWVLRISVGSTFAIHGWESLRLHPGFIDYLLAADRNLLGLGLTQHGAEIVLRLIAVHDIGLAAYVLVGRNHPGMLAGMACWGVITALARVVQGGEGALHLAVIRVANGGLPLVMMLLSPRISMVLDTRRLVGRLAHAALPLILLALPLAAGAQAIEGAGTGQLRIVWTEDPAHRATISWSTAAAGSTNEVHLDTESRGGVPGSYARTVAAGSNGEYATGGAFYHHADVTGLSPSTTYYFVVVSDGKASPERHFITGPADDRPFRILSGGDSRPPGEADRRKMNQMIAGLVEADPTILALAHGGDYIQSDDAWAEWDSWLTDQGLTTSASGRVLPIIPVRGNHEGDGVMYNEVFGFPGGPEVDYFATKLGANGVLLNLDTNSSIAGDQATWLEQHLKEAQAGRWILSSYHDPAYPAVKTPSGARQFWVPLFEKYNVDVAMESDGHVLKRTVPIRNDKLDPTGVVYVGEGGLGVPQRTPISEWYLESPGMAMSAHHVQMLSFSPTGLTYEARLMDGAVADKYEVEPKRTGAAVEPTPGPQPEPGPEPQPAPAPVTIAAVLARSADQLAVTYAVDMDAATTGVATAYGLSPAGVVRSVAMEDSRTAVLATEGLERGSEYQLVVSGVTSAEGAILSAPATATFRVPEAGQQPQPGTVTNPPTPATGDPAASPKTKESGCSTADGAFAWAGLLAVAAAAAAARRRRALR